MLSVVLGLGMGTGMRLEVEERGDGFGGRTVAYWEGWEALRMEANCWYCASVVLNGPVGMGDEQRHIELAYLQIIKERQSRLILSMKAEFSSSRYKVGLRSREPLPVREEISPNFNWRQRRGNDRLSPM